MILHRDDIQAGDRFEFKGNARIGRTAGVIVKVNRKTFDYSSEYMGSEMIVRAEQRDLIRPGLTKIERDGFSYDVVRRRHRLKLLPEQFVVRDIQAFLCRRG